MRLLKLPTEYKNFLNLMIDVSHEVGHFKHQHKKDGSGSAVVHSRYLRDLEYRLKVEHEAEAETTRVAKKYGFYPLINDLPYGAART